MPSVTSYLRINFWMSSIEKISRALHTPAGVALNPVGVPAQ